MKRQDVAVSIIVKGDKILLTQRYSPEKPATHLKWQLPGGGIEKGETIEDACIRESREETGFTVRILKKAPLLNINVYDNKEYLIHGFKCEIVSGTIDTELDEETNDAKWFTLPQIKDLECLDQTYELVASAIK